MKRNEIKKLYISAITIVIFIILLLTYVAFSTYHTLSSNKENAIAAIENQGHVILDFLLGSLRIILNEKELSITNIDTEKTITEILDDLTLDTKSINIIKYIGVINDNGTASYYRKPDFKINIKKLLSTFHENRKKDTFSKTIKTKNGPLVYEIARKIPFFLKDKQIGSISSKYIVIGLEMKKFESAREADIDHAIIMIAILMTLACSTLFFVYIIRNYYY